MKLLDASAQICYSSSKTEPAADVKFKKEISWDNIRSLVKPSVKVNMPGKHNFFFLYVRIHLSVLIFFRDQSSEATRFCEPFTFGISIILSCWLSIITGKVR